ncbi:MAG: hypothetical protein ACXVDF_03580 [Ktedonobacterales bacterium]
MGAVAELLHLPDYGVQGNGHGLIYERNSDEAFIKVARMPEPTPRCSGGTSFMDSAVFGAENMP